MLLLRFLCKVLECQSVYPHHFYQNHQIMHSHLYLDSMKLPLLNQSLMNLIHLDTRQDLYERVLHQDYIILDYSIVPFFAKYRSILVAALNFIITRYLEKINFVPRIAEKVSGNIPRTYLTNEEKQTILKMHDSCFYCNARTTAYYMD